MNDGIANRSFLLRKIRRILDQYAKAETAHGDQAETLADGASRELRELRPADVLAVLDEAVGKSSKRKQATLYLLSELADTPGASERLAAFLENEDSRRRQWVLQTIGLNELTKLGPVLVRVMLEDTDEGCRASAIEAAGRIRSEECFETILRLGLQGRHEDAVVSALVRYGRPEARPFLRSVFERALGPEPSAREFRASRYLESREAVQRIIAWESQKFQKLYAAWGLAKLGDNDAVAHLGATLYYRSPLPEDNDASAFPRRAAQALADVFGLPFEWSGDSWMGVRTWWEGNRHRFGVRS